MKRLQQQNEPADLYKELLLVIIYHIFVNSFVSVRIL